MRLYFGYTKLKYLTQVNLQYSVKNYTLLLVLALVLTILIIALTLYRNKF